MSSLAWGGVATPVGTTGWSAGAGASSTFLWVDGVPEGGSPHSTAGVVWDSHLGGILLVESGWHFEWHQ